MALVDVNEVKKQDFELLQAVKKKKVLLVSLLINGGADINMQDETGNTPLLTAIANESPILVNVLISAGADINQADRFGYTPLMSACLRGSQEVFKALLNAGADISIRNPVSNRTVYEIAQNDNLEAISLIEERIAKVEMEESEKRIQPVMTEVFGMSR